MTASPAFLDRYLGTLSLKGHVQHQRFTPHQPEKTCNWAFGYSHNIPFKGSSAKI